jgi:phage baseplate assembly protein W
MAYKNLVIKPPKYVNADTTKKSHFYKGFSTIASNTGVSLYDNELVKQDLLNHFSTRKGERVMDPTYGTIIWDALFDPLTDDLKEQIKQDIAEILQNDPRLYPTDINVVEKEQGLLIEITTSYVNSDQSDVLKISFDRQLGLSVQ